MWWWASGSVVANRIGTLHRNALPAVGRWLRRADRSGHRQQGWALRGSECDLSILFRARTAAGPDLDRRYGARVRRIGGDGSVGAGGALSWPAVLVMRAMPGARESVATEIAEAVLPRGDARDATLTETRNAEPVGG
jgi:hypothetical protein